MGIPPDARIVYKGTIFEVYQWEQKMFDGSIKTFERIKRCDTIQILPVMGSKILLAEEEQPDEFRGLGFFGGRIEVGEEPLAAAKRELLEEAGCVSDDWELWRVIQPVSKMEWSVYFFIARDVKKVAEQSLDSGERIQVRESSIEEIFSLARSEGWRDTECAYHLLGLEHDLDRLKGFRKLLGIP